MPDQPQFERFTITLPADEARTLRESAKEASVSMTDVVRRGLKLDAFIREEMRKDHKILVEEAPGQIKRLVIR